MRTFRAHMFWAILLGAAAAAFGCSASFKKAARRLDVVMVKVVGRGVPVVSIHKNHDMEACWLAHLKTSVDKDKLSENLIRGIRETGGKPTLPFSFTTSFKDKASGTLKLHVEGFGLRIPGKGPAELFYTVWAKMEDIKGRRIYKRRINCTSKGFIDLSREPVGPADASWQPALFVASMLKKTLPEITNVPAALKGLSYMCGVRVVEGMRKDWN